jgi:hypothetical protein
LKAKIGAHPNLSVILSQSHKVCVRILLAKATFKIFLKALYEKSSYWFETGTKMWQDSWIKSDM